MLKLHLFFRSKSYKRKEDRHWKLEKVKAKKYTSTFIAITKYSLLGIEQKTSDCKHVIIIIIIIIMIIMAASREVVL